MSPNLNPGMVRLAVPSCGQLLHAAIDSSPPLTQTCESSGAYSFDEEEAQCPTQGKATAVDEKSVTREKKNQSNGNSSTSEVCKQSNRRFDFTCQMVRVHSI